MHMMEKLWTLKLSEVNLSLAVGEYQLPFLCSSAGEPALSEMGILSEGQNSKFRESEPTGGLGGGVFLFSREIFELHS